MVLSLLLFVVGVGTWGDGLLDANRPSTQISTPAGGGCARVMDIDGTPLPNCQVYCPWDPYRCCG